MLSARSRVPVSSTPPAHPPFTSSFCSWTPVPFLTFSLSSCELSSLYYEDERAGLCSLRRSSTQPAHVRRYCDQPSDEYVRLREETSRSDRYLHAASCFFRRLGGDSLIIKTSITEITTHRTLRRGDRCSLSDRTTVKPLHGAATSLGRWLRLCPEQA